MEVDAAPATGAAQQRKTLALLALLAAARGRGVSRDKVIAYLWPESDAEPGRHLLKQACYALRRDLHAPDLFLGTLELRLNPAVITSDIDEFESALDRGDAAQAVARYTGPFLDGFYLNGAGAFERWVEEERVRLVKRAFEALERLATDAGSADDPKTAVTWWRRLTELDPLSAQAALGLMCALDDAGERAEAVEHGGRYAAFVRTELGAEPSSDVLALTEELHRQTAVGARTSKPRGAVRPPDVVP